MIARKLGSLRKSCSIKSHSGSETLGPPHGSLPCPTRGFPDSKVLKFRISLANEPGETYEVDGFEAVLGRAPTCDVVVAQKHITVSGKHARVMAGVVVLDLGSANGTFVSARNIANGNKVAKGQVAGAEVAPGGEFTIGNSVHVRVETDALGASDGGTQPGTEDLQGRLAALDLALSEERERNEVLNRKMQEALERAGEISEDAALNHPSVRRIVDERDDFKRRLASRTKEMEQAHEDASSGAESQNLLDQAEAARKRSEQLQTEVSELRHRVDELLVENRRLTAPGGATPEVVGDPPTQPDGASKDALAQLRAEVQRLTELNRTLKSELDARPQPDADPKPDSSPSEVFKRLNAEILRLNGELKAANKKDTKPDGAPPSGGPGSSPTTPVMVGGGLSVLKKLAEGDLDALPQDIERPVDQFFYAEMFRFVRTSEKLLTSVVRKALDLMDGSTIIPGQEQTLRQLTAAIIEKPTDSRTRIQFNSYVKELERWMFIGTQIFPEAATKYAVELRDSISKNALVAGNPIPRMLQLSGGADGELWRRAQALLSDQSGDVIRDRISALARDAASRMHPGR